MQTSGLNSPVIPQRLLTQHQQCSPGIDNLIQKAGKHAVKICEKIGHREHFARSSPKPTPKGENSVCSALWPPVHR